MIYDPHKFYGEDDRRSLSLARLRLSNGLAQRTLARTPVQLDEAEAKITQAQSELSALYLPYLQSAKKAEQEAMSLNDILTVIDTTTI